MGQQDVVEQERRPVRWNVARFEPSAWRAWMADIPAESLSEGVREAEGPGGPGDLHEDDSCQMR